MAIAVAADDADAAAAAADSRKVCCPRNDNLVSRQFAAGGTGEGASCWFGKDVSKMAGGIGGACIGGIATSKTVISHQAQSLLTFLGLPIGLLNLLLASLGFTGLLLLDL